MHAVAPARRLDPAMGGGHDARCSEVARAPGLSAARESRRRWRVDPAYSLPLSVTLRRDHQQCRAISKA